MIWKPNEGGLVELNDLREKLLKQYDIRVQDHMGRYVLAKLNQSAPIKMIGGNARTGVPMVLEINPAQFAAPPQAT